jgi:caa(3)-type oxidase subunit IV
MSEHAAGEQGHEVGTTKLFVIVWLMLVAITAVEVWLAYRHIDPTVMLVLLIGMSVAKAGLIMSYFMHLKYEKFSLTLLLIPATVFCICMLSVIFPDGFRLLHIGRP